MNWRLWTLLVCTVALVGCGTFSREWKAAGSLPQSPSSINGQWIGTWQNTNNTHQDVMRAVLIQKDDQTVEAHFDAVYKRIIHFRYRTTFHGSFQGDAFTFEGSEDLGKLAGGLYRYDGTIRPGEFFSRYSSKYDTGTYTLRRPRAISTSQ